MPVVGTKAAASAQGFGEFAQASGTATYIEDVFSTYLYTGNGSTQTITNGIDLSGKGGLVWTKGRSNAFNNLLIDTSRGANKYLISNDTIQEQTSGVDSIPSFSSSGYSLGSASAWNNNTSTFVSWTFRKQPKFFDVVTYTGNGSTQNISHNLGAVPGCIIVKATNTTSQWEVYHRSLTLSSYVAKDLSLQLNSTNSVSPVNSWNLTAPTSTVFSVGNNSATNASGNTYVAYLFAHDAGGFGLNGSDNVISCGLTTANGSGDFSVNLGYEPQWVLMKSTGSGIWSIVDNMRGATASSGYTSSQRLQPQSSAAEDTLSGGYGIGINATGFTGNLATFSNDFIYIAIRRGPMKTPTSGTSVFAPVAYTGTGATRSLTAGFPIDLALFKVRNQTLTGFNWFDRLRGTSPDLRSSGTFAELATTTEVTSFASNTQVTVGASNDTNGTNANGYTYVLEAFRRAPGFFDMVCWTGNGVAVRVNHNLGVAPELIILKSRSGATNWIVRPPGVANNFSVLNSTAAVSSGSGNFINNPTATYFDTGDNAAVNTNNATYVAYLFASVAGVSKVGSYTGTIGTQTISCGFAARFVLIKRTDSLGSWWVWDTARGMVAGTDPRLELNNTNAETNANWVYTDASGFQIVTTDATVNALGGSYIYLAIA